MIKMPGLRSPDKASGERKSYQSHSRPLPSFPGTEGQTGAKTVKL